MPAPSSATANESLATHETSHPAMPQHASALAIFSLMLRVAVGVVFVVAGVGKLGNATAATVATQNALGIGGALASVVATGISVVEIILGVLLVIGLNLRWAAPATALLCAALLLIVIKLWMQGFTGGCGCFGVFGGGSPGPEETLRDGALLLAAVGAWATSRFGPALDRLLSR